MLLLILTDRVQLADPSLLRSACYVNGEWVGAASGKTFAIVGSYSVLFSNTWAVLLSIQLGILAGNFD